MDGLFARQVAGFKVLVEQHFVVFRGRLHQAVLHFLHLCFQVVGNGDFLRARRGETIGFFLQRVDTALHFPVFHDGNLNGGEFACVFLFQRPDGTGVIGVFLIHAVDEDDERFAQAQTVVHDALRADGKHAVGADDEQRSACRAQSLVALPFKIVEAGKIQQVDFYAFPHQIGTSGVHGHLFCFFKFVKIGHGGAVRHFPLTVGGAAVEQHGFAQRGLAFPAVPDDRNVTDIFSRDTHKNRSPLHEIFSAVALFAAGRICHHYNISRVIFQEGFENFFRKNQKKKKSSRQVCVE